MSKLIGNNPEQVPSNADLGTAAFMDAKEFLTARGSNLSAIENSIRSTTTDVFIYDTSLDSDGGAWRKRTQHTSWYNERLNTRTRGNRKEFPSVAVIVVDPYSINIYDADDPTLPMWMNFGRFLPGFIYTTPTCTAMSNGILCIGINPNSSNYYDAGVKMVGFVSDTLKGYSYALGLDYHKPVSERNMTSTTGLTVEVTQQIVNPNVNAIAMKVLPNSNVDHDTKLPIPTVAVATNGGISIIRHDGVIRNITNSGDTAYQNSHTIDFIGTDEIIFGFDTSAGARNIRVHNIPARDEDISALWYEKGTSKRFYKGYDIGTDPDLYILGENSSNKKYIVQGAIGSNMGLTILDENPAIPTAGSVAFVGTDFNTGYLLGDNKVATLADTKIGQITSGNHPNLLSGGWTNNGSFPYETLTQSGLDFTAVNTTAYGAVNKTWTATAGKVYTAKFDMSLSSGVYPRLFTQTSSSFGNGVEYQTRAGTNYFTFRASMSTSSYFTFATSNGDATNYSVTNLELYEGGVEDFTRAKSGGGNTTTYDLGFSIVGNIDKNPVASGAELNGFSASSSGSYLEQTYNSDLDFGTTGDFLYSFWVYSDPSANYNSATYIFERTSVSDPNSRRIEARMNTSTNLQVYACGLGFVNNSTAITLESNKWNKVDIFRRSGIGEVWVNGKEKASGAHSGNMSDSTATLTVCNRGYFSPHNQGFPTGISLFRVSGTAPSDIQILETYKKELPLFQEGAKATLYGSSNSITAMSYDDSKDFLHVGTSEGRSVFQGLRRIDNTRSAISTAISASNGMVAEE